MAARHHGLITRADADRVGLTRHQVYERLRAGRWIRVAPGVYRVAGAPLVWPQAVLAACLAGPAGTVASHLTAAALWGLQDPPLQPHVTVPRRASARLPIAVVHRSDLPSADHTMLGVMPVTTVARTLVDAGALLPDVPLADLVDTAIVAGKTTVAAITGARDRAGRAPGRPGTARLGRVLEAWAGDITPGSPAELRLIRQLREWGFPEPVCQHVVRSADGGAIGRLDVAWPSRRVGLEYDSPRWHGPRRWQSDEDRHGALRAVGWTLLRADKLDLLPGRDHLRERRTTVLRAA